jgi:hypothetical protein
VQQHVALAHRAQDVVVLVERRGPGRHERRVAQRVDVDLVDQRGEAHQVDRAVAAVELVVAELELREQEPREVLGAAVGDLEAQRHAELPVRQLALQRLAQVLDLLLVEPQVGVARHAELRVRHDLAPGKEAAEVLVQDRGEQQERVVAGAQRRGQLHHARQHARRLDDRDRGLAPERVGARQLDDKVEALVADLRERVRGIEPDRREQRAHLVAERRGDPLALRRRELAPAQQPHAAVGERGQDLGVEARVLVGDQRMRLGGDRGVGRAELAQRHPRRRHLRAQVAHHAGDADLEELVEVRRDDRQEAQPLEQRDRRVVREREHAPVEREQRELAVDRRAVDVERLGGAQGPGARRGRGARVGEHRAPG